MKFEIYVPEAVYILRPISDVLIHYQPESGVKENKHKHKPPNSEIYVCHQSPTSPFAGLTLPAKLQSASGLARKGVGDTWQLCGMLPAGSQATLPTYLRASAGVVQ